MLTNFTPKPSKVQQVMVSTETAGQRLDNFLFTYLKGVPKTRIYRIIRKGEVRINKGRIKPDYRLAAGDCLRIPPIRQADPTESLIPASWKDQAAERLMNQVLYEDDGLIVLNKPAGMAVHGGSGVSLGVIEALRHLRGPEKTLELVHRLDRDTSGCLMIAKRRSTLKAIHEQFQAGTVEKIYWTLVKGRWNAENEVTEIFAPLKKNQLSGGERIVRVQEDGQTSLTEFRVLKRYTDTTLMEARPKTGRTHQIRVHATYAGHPIVGDDKYGDDSFNRQMKLRGIARLFLHAFEINVKLPGHESPISIQAPLESDLQRCLSILTEDTVDD